MDVETVFIAADGGCSGNGKTRARASYAYCIANYLDIVTALRDKNIAEFCCVENARLLEGPSITNNIAELTAIKEGLARLESECMHAKNIAIASDSEYSLMSIDVWSRDWDKTPTLLEGKKNLGLIKEIRSTVDDLRARGYNVTMNHLRGHKKAPVVGTDVNGVDDIAYIKWFLNDRVDKMCQGLLY